MSSVYTSIPIDGRPDNKLMKNKAYINVKRRLNSAANHGLNLTTISPLKLTAELLMFIFTEIIYSLPYNILITEN